MHLLGKTKEELFLKDLNETVENLKDEDKKKLSNWISRLKKGEPISKIVGKKHFWKREFFINEFVLDPRPESETMIEAVISEIPDKDKHYRILDLGSGSGCLILSLCDEYIHATGIGLDISKDAIEVANKNNNYKDRVEFLGSNWGNDVTGHFDVIVSNPPYIAYNEQLDKSVLDYDPSLALYGGENGLEQYILICESLKNISFEYIFFEVGYTQSNDVTKIVLDKLKVNHIKTYKDILNIDRIICFKSK